MGTIAKQVRRLSSLRYPVFKRRPFICSSLVYCYRISIDPVDTRLASVIWRGKLLGDCRYTKRISTLRFPNVYLGTAASFELRPIKPPFLRLVHERKFNRKLYLVIFPVALLGTRLRKRHEESKERGNGGTFREKRAVIYRWISSKFQRRCWEHSNIMLG